MEKEMEYQWTGINADIISTIIRYHGVYNNEY